MDDFEAGVIPYLLLKSELGLILKNKAINNKCFLESCLVKMGRNLVFKEI